MSKPMQEVTRKVEWARLTPFLVLFPVLLAYANSLAGTFLYDDFLRIVRNPDLPHLWDSMVGSSRPLSALSLHLNYRFGGLNVVYYHVVNVALHAGAALVLFGLVRRTLQLPRLARTAGRDAGLIAAAAAALWAVHPLQTESVTYIVQRAEGMMGLFYLVTVYFLVVGVRSAWPDRWYTASVVACALGMASKPVMVTAPVIVLAFDRFFVAGSLPEAFRRRWRYYVALAATWLVLAALLVVPHESSTSAGPQSGVASPLLYLATQPAVILHYLRIVAWPDRLCLDYGWPAASTLREILPASCVIGGVLIAMVAGVMFRKGWAFTLLWFFVILLPTSSLIPIADFAVEHRLYLPLAGLCVLVAAGTRYLLLRFSAPEGGRRGMTFWIWCATMLVAVGALTVRTRARNTDYDSIEVMFRSVIAQRPDNLRARMALSSHLLREHRAGEAEEVARELLQQIRTGLQRGGKRYEGSATHAAYFFAPAQAQYGRALLLQGRYDAALVQLDAALAVRPDYDVALHQKALALYGKNDVEGAEVWARRAVEVEPLYVDPRAFLAFILAEKGEYGRAIAEYQSALRVRREHLFSMMELAWLLATVPEDGLRDGIEAEKLARKVCEATQYSSAAGLDVLGAALAERGDFERAIECAQRALELSQTETGVDDRAARGVGVGGAERGKGRPGAAADIAARLLLYRAGRPFRISGAKKESSPGLAGAALTLHKAATVTTYAPGVWTWPPVLQTGFVPTAP